MKQKEVQKIPYGETFRAFRDTFVALDRVEGGVLAIRRDIWKKAPFNKDGNNNLHKAGIGKELTNYMIELLGDNVNAAGIINTSADLKATDGTREYGFFRHRAVLLTLEQYGRYQHIIPRAKDEWWLATPHMTPGQKNGDSQFVWYAGFNGISYGNCSFVHGIRPVLVFAPSLLVGYDDGGEEQDGTEEDTLYEKYIEYMYDWLNNWGEVCGVVGESPMNYETWKAWDEGDE